MEINLWDLPQDKTYLKLNKHFHALLFGKAIRKVGSQENLAQILCNSGNKFANDIKINQQYISRLVNDYQCTRLDMILFIANLIDLPIIELQKNVLVIKGVGTSKAIFNPKLPFKLDENLSMLVSKLNCDGSVSEPYSFTAEYVNKNKRLIEDFKSSINNIFGNTEIKCYTNDGIIRARITGYLGFLITIFFGHTDADRIPTEISKSNLDIKRAFIRNVFDDEGCVSKDTGQIKLKMLHKEFIKDVKDILEDDFGIKCSNISEDRSSRYSNNTYYYFRISNRFNLQRFRDEIGFSHLKKMRRLEHRLRNVKKIEYPKHVAQPLIYDILKSSPMTTKEIAYILNRGKRIVQSHLNELKKKGLVCYELIKRRYSYEFLWKVRV